MEGLEVIPGHLTYSFWRNKRVLVTGHSGFKGAWLTLWLQRMGAVPTGISLPPSTSPNLFALAEIDSLSESHFIDIRDSTKLSDLIKTLKPEIVFHLAAQPLVRASYRDPLETFSTNIMGTVNVLNAMRVLDSVRVAVMITTDKVYRNNEWLWPYREDDALGGYDPYSASKAASEIVISSYRNSFLEDQNIAVASARAGNVIGGGDWSEDRLIPDAIRAWQAGRPLEIRRPDAIRPWQHVLEPLAGYLFLAEKLWQQPTLAGAYNFGPQNSEAATVRNVVEIVRKAYGEGEVSFMEGNEGPYEAKWLALEVAKSNRVLGVRSRWGLEEAVKRTIGWYRAQQEGGNSRLLCEAEIAAYEAIS